MSRDAALHILVNSPPVDNSFSGITQRQLEIIKLVVHGYTNEMIGKRLNISENTVKAMLRRVARTLKIDNKYKNTRVVIAITYIKHIHNIKD